MSRYWRNKRIWKGAAVICVSAVGGTVLGLKYISLNAAVGEKPEPWPIFGPPSVSASWTNGYTPSVEWDHNWDRRSPKMMVKPKKSDIDEINNEYIDKIEAAAPKANRHLILIRHGQYFEDEKTDAKRLLTPLGREQADLTGARLKELNHPYTKLVNSTMSRAIETANIIFKHLPDVPRESCDLLREGAPIPPEPPVGHWRPQVHFYEDGARIEAAFRQYFHRASASQEKDTYEILVCHANVIRYFVCRALQFPPDAWLRLCLHHASITWLVIRPSGRVSMMAMGDCGHIPPEKLTVR